MADEFNPQGVDQTPQNNENPNNTADTGNIEPKNPFVGGASVDAGNASDSSEQQAPVPPAAPAADQRPTQAVTDTAATEPIPDYASAKGESTVVSSSPASPAAPRSSVSATRSCQSASSLYFHWIAVPLFRTSGSAVSVFAALLHPAASTMQSTNRAAQSAKSEPVSSFSLFSSSSLRSELFITAKLTRSKGRCRQQDAEYSFLHWLFSSCLCRFGLSALPFF